jgi:TPR repeat protein
LGNADALYMMGLFFEGGLGVRKDSQRAFRSYVEAAANGNDDAQLRLGVYFSKGMRGVRKNLPEAVRYLKLATANGNDAALSYLLARWLQDKMPGVTDKEVLLYAQKASQSGGENAELGRLVMLAIYDDEDSPLWDPTKARGWHLVLKKGGSEKLRRDLANLPPNEFATLTSEQISASDKWAEACMSSAYSQCD